MAIVSKFSIQCQTKSISLPSRSHPTTLQIEELLNKIKTTTSSSFRPSVQTICSGLSQLTELYKCMDDLLNSSTVRVLMARQRNEKWVDELIEESVKFLDICGGIWDVISQIKEQIRDLQCALRRRNGELSSENNGIAKYICFRKKMKKDVKELVANLKQVYNMTSGGSMVVDSDSHQLAAVMKAVLGVSEMTISVFESLLMFFCMPSVSKPNKWSFVVSKLIHKGMVACEAQQKQVGSVNEFESIDAELHNLCKYGISSEGGNVQIAQSRLERLGAQIESMESGLECTFRCLVRTRASLLNIISQ